MCYMSKNKTHLMILAVITVACVGFTIVSALEDWEFWVPPLLIAGAVALWVMHFTRRGEERARENLYFIYAILAAFFHGVHETSIFDVAVVSAMMLALFSLMDHIYMLNMILAEYAMVMGIQVTLALRGGTALDSLGVPSIALQATAVVCVYMVCRMAVGNRLDAAVEISRHETQTEENESETETEEQP